MRSRTSRIFEKGAAVFALALCLSVVQARATTADPVFMWAVDGTQLVGLSSVGTPVANATFNASTISGSTSFFSLAVAGTQNAQNIFVADSESHQLYEFNWNWSTTGQGRGTLSQSGTTFTFTGASNISPQEIAIDPSGNLWTTDFDGQIQEYTPATGGGSGTTIVKANSGLVTGARGIMINSPVGQTPTQSCSSTVTTGCTVYVTVEGAYGSGGLDYFSAGSNPTVTDYSTLSASTTPAGNETGQMRGVTEDTFGNIYYVDSTWGPSGTGDGYICEVAKGAATGNTCNPASPFLSTPLNGPNEIVSGDGNGGAGGYASSCDDLYVANYYGNNIVQVQTSYTTGGVASGCGTAGTNQVFASSLTNVTGLAFGVGAGNVNFGIGGGNEGPTFLFPDSSVASPEPGTWVLMLSALLAIVGAQVWRRRRVARA